uniref:SAP domain-containing protein n=1 Tax=Haemonchus placei TaxID=6290 RepID=A0A0N4VT62_HAEPC
LTRRGLSRVGIRQDLIDRLLDDINGIVKKEEPCSEFSVITKDTSESQNLDSSSPLQDGAESGESRPTSTTETTPQAKGKRLRLNLSGKKSDSSNETPAARSRKPRQRASAGEDIAVPNKEVTVSCESTAHLNDEAPQSPVDIKPSKEEIACPAVEPTPTCSIMKPILSILPKVRPLPSLFTPKATSSAETSGTTSTMQSRPQRHSDNVVSSPIFTNSDIYDSSADEKPPVSERHSGVLRKFVFLALLQSEFLCHCQARKSSAPKDDDDRHGQKKNSISSISKADRLSTAKPITEAWAERLAELKKSDPSKFSAGPVVKEKSKERDVELRRKPTGAKPSVSSAGAAPSNVKKSSSTGSKTAEGLDLLDSILNQQSEFLQTMRRSEDRCSPEPVRAAPRVDQPEGISEHQGLERAPDLSGAAEEAYRRFEQTFSESNSSKSSPKSPQFLSLLPPPPPPPKPVQQTITSKKSLTLSPELVQLLVPPPPPPPPPPQPPLPPLKDVPPPPPPRRPKVSNLEDLPPPPPPPKRLKPARPTAANKETTAKDPSGLVEPNQEVPSENSKADDPTIMADVKTCLEHVVFLVSSIRPFDEISGELLPAKEVPVPFSQRLERGAASDSDGVASSSADAPIEKKTDGEGTSSVEDPQKEVPNEDEEEYDPVDASVVEEFEVYVPSAVVSRNVTLDELNSSITPPLELPNPEHDQYSPSSNTGLHIDEDLDEGEITDDSDSEIQSIADSDDDSEYDEGVPDQETFMRHDENGRLVRVVRRTRKRNDQVSSLNTQPENGVMSSLDNTMNKAAEEEEFDLKPDREILDDPRHLLQRASAVLQGLGKGEGTQYTQMPYDEDYEEEECIQPMDSFHGEPVPDDDELFEVTAYHKLTRLISRKCSKFNSIYQL